MEDKFEIPITVEYFGEDPLWRYISPRDDLKAKELAPNVVLEYQGTYFRKALDIPQIDWFSLIVTYTLGYLGYKTYPYLDKAIDKLVALIKQGVIKVVKIGAKEISPTHYSEEELKRIIKEAIDEYIRGE